MQRRVQRTGSPTPAHAAACSIHPLRPAPCPLRTRISCGASRMLPPDTTLGPYKILSPIGAGGMGEVYRAIDSRLGRHVAIKVLSQHLTNDTEATHRFEQEARSAGQLNHPNILAIYDIGIEDGMRYIVSELLEGESMRARIRQGAIPPRRAADYAMQIARGLAAAHERGI